MNGAVAPRLLVGVTVGASAHALLRGQLTWYREQGWDVSLVSTPDELALRAAEREGVQLHGISMHRGLSPARDLVALKQWISLIRSERPDAVSLGTPKAALLGMIAAWLVHVPKRLYVVRGLRLEGVSRPLGRVLWIMEWLTIKMATDVFFVSRSLKAEAERRGLHARGKAWLIGSGSSNGVDAARVAERAGRSDRRELRRQLGFSDGDFVVGFIGRVSRDKGVGTLVQAVSSSEIRSNVKLLLIGGVEDARLAEDVRVLGQRVTIVEWTDDVWGYLAAIDVLCLPSLREGFPNVVLEAASAGKPSITTRATGAIDSVVDGVTGLLVDVEDDRALTRAINRLAVDSGLVESLGRAARAWAAAEFQPESIWNGMQTILKAADPANSDPASRQIDPKGTYK